MPLIPRQAIIAVPIKSNIAANGIKALNLKLEDFSPVRIISLAVVTNQRTEYPGFAGLSDEDKDYEFIGLSAEERLTKFSFASPDQLIAVIELI